MLSLSQTTGYAILALSCLDVCRDRWVLAKDIAGCAGIPRPYLSKLLNALSGTGLIRAKRGYRGGFQLARSAKEISLLDVVKAVEGRDWLPQCLLGLKECSDQCACPTHGFWKKERERIEKELMRTSVHDVARFERQRRGSLTQCDYVI